MTTAHPLTDLQENNRMWQPIGTAPKDGTLILAHGTAFREFVERQQWSTTDDGQQRVPCTMLIKWIEGWYDKEVDLGNGTFRKERTRGYAYWWSEPHAFHPTHWMPLPEPPTPTTSEAK